MGPPVPSSAESAGSTGVYVQWTTEGPPPPGADAVVDEFAFTLTPLGSVFTPVESLVG
ncbi:MAG: hypothetical protein ACYDC4_11800 [Candidatus Dormibacteria bacterium]